MIGEAATNQGPRSAAVTLLLLAALASCSSNNTLRPTGDGGADIGAIDVIDVPPPPPDVFRCASNASCAGSPGRPLCNTTSGECVGCSAMPTACMASQYCNTATGACEAGCSSDMGCTAPGDGGVSLMRCDTATHTCVACVTNDHCPPGNLCRGSVCVAGCSMTRPCPTGQSCCDGACIDTQSNVAACGMCGTTCRTINGTAACSAGMCSIGACSMGYDNCDMNAANGCEVNTQNDPNNCGMCGNRCPVGTGASGTCVGGRCGIACGAGVGDCNADPMDGCETNTVTSNTHCGACGRACAPANGVGMCASGSCTIASCNTGFGDCDMDPGNGCESNTATNAFACGRCGNTCSLANAEAGCAAGACTIARCNPGFLDCDGMAANGCEVNSDSSATNCGMCGRSCGAGTCSRGDCLALCTGGLGDCDANPSNGCEATLATDALNCGACRNACIAGPQATPRCAAGACSVTCATGFANCNTSTADGCEIDTRISPTNCGACGNACPSGQVCNASVCVAPCPGVQQRCSGTCVSLLTSNTNCGACGNACATGSTCTDGVCRCAIGTEPLAGVRCGSTCVDVLSNNANCGTCGTACLTGSTCTRGVCRCNVSGIPIGVLCGTTCVDPFSDRDNCGGCGRACPTGNTCNTGVCRCPTGGITCGSTCTDPMVDRNNCGTCGTVCSSTTACQSGVCRACATGTTLCAGVCADTQNDVRNCGGCSVACPSGQVCLAGGCTSAPPTRYSSTANPSGLTFLNACGMSGSTTYLPGADDSNVVVTLPFAFRYWATNLIAGASINITSNGWIGMDGVSTATYNFPIPTTTTPNSVVAAYEGDDYNRSTGQCVAVTGVAPTRRWIHTWNDSAHCCDNSSTGAHTTYSIYLNEGSNIIEFVYSTMTGARAEYVGLENQTGSAGIGGCSGGGFSCAPAAGSSIRFNPIP